MHFAMPEDNAYAVFFLQAEAYRNVAAAVVRQLAELSR